jgi:short-subunit dehydrogenase
VEEAASAIEDTLGPLDVWVNDAMVSVYSPARDLHADEIERVIAVNCLGTVYGTLAALRRMRPRDRGTIVQVGSALAIRAIPLQAAYCASKHAIRGFTESVRTELLHDGSGIRITMVQLPGLNTPHFTRVRNRMPRGARPIAPIYTAEFAARAILHATEHPRKERLVGAPTALVVAAQRVAPGLLDRYFAKVGYDAQMTEEVSRPRPDNLFAPLPGDPGTDGPFAGVARSGSLQVAISRHRGTAAAAAAAALVWTASRARR